MVLKRQLRTFLILLTLVGIAVAWWVNRQAALSLHDTIASLRVENARLPSLRDERDRLQKLRRDTIDIANLQRSTRDPLPTATPASAAQTEEVSELPTALVAGNWVPSTAWQKRGDHTPTATVETVLWAAAGGDVAQLKNLLLIDADVREKSAAIYWKLPPQVRANFTSAEDLIAASAIKSIPLGQAQLIWQQQADEDHAVLGLFLRSTEPVSARLKTSIADPASNAPPSLPANPTSKSVFLSLRRTPQNEWRLIVPISAVTKLAHEFASSATP